MSAKSKDQKSKFLSDAEVAKEQLDKISPSMCLAKWKQVSLHLTNGMNNSCYHPPLHAIPVDAIAKDPSKLHNTDYKKEQRAKMIAGDRPSECSYCWAMEDNGKLSDRHYRSGEPWAIESMNDIMQDPMGDVKPSYVEVNFNHACNLECSYCSPQFSSSWMRQAKQFGAYPTSTPHNDPAYFTGQRRPIPHSENNPYVEAFWKWWPDLYKELKHFRMTGGEPLMDKNTYRVFDYVLENPKPDLHLNVTSNFSVEEKLWKKYKDYVKRICDGENVEHFMQYVSIDSIGKQAEYIRHGMDCNLVYDRVLQYLDEIPTRNSLTFIITMNNLSITRFDHLLETILELRKEFSKTYQRVWFDTPVLRNPSWQSLQILPDSWADKLKDIQAWMQENQTTQENQLHGFKDYEVNRLDRAIAWMQEPLDTEYVTTQKADFYRFFSEYDKRTGNDFVSTFPELAAWWEECKYLSDY